MKGRKVVSKTGDGTPCDLRKALHFGVEECIGDQYGGEEVMQEDDEQSEETIRVDYSLTSRLPMVVSSTVA